MEPEQPSVPEMIADLNQAVQEYQQIMAVLPRIIQLIESPTQRQLARAMIDAVLNSNQEEK